MIRVGVLNVTGYAGVEAARLLLGHPDARMVAATGRGEAGKPLASVFPHLFQYDLTITPEIDTDVDVIIGCLPHAASAAALLPFVERGIPVVDVSADFRLKDAAEYQLWYNIEHPSPRSLEQAVYGLPELHRDEIRRSRLVGNPGCYPTAAILALAPAYQAGIIDPGIIVDSKSGISGAGRGVALGYHFAEADEDFVAYGLKGHRHLPEITQELGLLAEAPPPRVTFVPHLLPMVRGIEATCYADLRLDRLGADPEAEVRELYRSFYADAPFTRVVDAPPHTKHTAGTNYCLVYPFLDRRTNRLVVSACLDNLVKGASGQAIENMNLMLGLPQTAGLDHPALYP
ncbi:MAG: N-acetyl-gamma-glutamyl-phosphate reductase [Dehalococcoidia bacterium]